MRAFIITRATVFGASVALVATAVLINAATSPAAFATGYRICSKQNTGIKDTAHLSYGVVHFANSCKASVQPALQLAIAKLHSFEAEPQEFATIGRKDPGCAIAWWGAAMSARGNPLGGSLDDKSLRAGRKLIDQALTIRNVTPRESALVAAMDTYYRSYPDQITRARAYAERMDGVEAAYPDDPDIGAFDGLAIIEGVDLNDKTYARQKRAGAILERVMKTHPENPGAPHYLIHAYDYTALAPQAVHAAEIYPTLATASSHAQHMPAHIWSMLGRWDRSIDANRRSSFLADPASAYGNVKGDIVFEHAFDFIAYARLQKGEDRHVAEDLAALGAPPLVIAARYALERGDWAAAARLRVPADDPFDAALARFTRAYGAARAGDTGVAQRELSALRNLRAQVASDAGEYWGVFVDIYVKTAQGWLFKAEGRQDAALASLRQAADQDDGHEKHIYLENKIMPARESLADLELALKMPKQALADYEASLKLAPDRYRSFAGAAAAAEAVGDKEAARRWSERLLKLAKDGDHARPAYAAAQAYLAGHG